MSPAEEESDSEAGTTDAGADGSDGPVSRRHVLKVAGGAAAGDGLVGSAGSARAMHNHPATDVVPNDAPDVPTLNYWFSISTKAVCSLSSGACQVSVLAGILGIVSTPVVGGACATFGVLCGTRGTLEYAYHEKVEYSHVYEVLIWHPINWK